MLRLPRKRPRLSLALSLLLMTQGGSAHAVGAADLDQRIDALVADIQDRVADVPVIRAQQLRDAIASAEPPILLDVREPRERAVSVIPGAVSDASGIPPGAAVVVYCTVGLRSGNAARALRQQGYAAVNLRGGILAWLAAGGGVVDAQGAPTRRVHVYGPRWAAVPADVEAVW